MVPRVLTAWGQGKLREGGSGCCYVEWSQLGLQVKDAVRSGGVGKLPAPPPHHPVLVHPSALSSQILSSQYYLVRLN